MQQVYIKLKTQYSDLFLTLKIRTLYAVAILIQSEYSVSFILTFSCYSWVCTDRS